MLFDEAYSKTKMQHAALLHEAEQERLAADARLHTQQVLNDTARSLQEIRPYVSIFDLIGVLLRSKRYAN